jgi:hyaluronan synthase
LKIALAIVFLAQLATLVVLGRDHVQVLTAVLPAGVEVSPRGAAALAFAVATSVAMTIVLALRVFLVSRYRPVVDVGDDALPRLTVVVPAFNEGRQVLLTLRSLAASRYPRRRLQIVAVDDGSTDDTWSFIEAGAAEHPELVTAVRCPKNGGKRQALLEGFARATGDVIITVDSDSEVMRDTLRLMVGPLVKDPNCGAVAGNVRVLNREGGIIPRMLEASFTSAFDFIRAAESVGGAVMCCPGALSAWRRSIIDDVKGEWSRQTFFGYAATIGEDRALTNLVLRGGYTVAYQADAIVLTQVPVTVRVLCKMLLRWGRSNVRESIVLGRFLFSNVRRDGGGRGITKVLYLWGVTRTALSALVAVPALAVVLSTPALLPWLALATALGALPMAAITTARRGLHNGVWAFPWAFFALVCTSWIGFYALVTAHKSGWLTRAHTPSLPASSSTSLASSSAADASSSAMLAT